VSLIDRGRVLSPVNFREVQDQICQATQPGADLPGLAGFLESPQSFTLGQKLFKNFLDFFFIPH
jgi:hypothetical protein